METAEKDVQLSLLLVDDDRELCGMMKEFFAGAGHRLDCEYDGRRGLARAASGTYDLVILDVMLPRMDGYEVCREIRKTSDTPIIMLTAVADVSNRIQGLEIGADDYVVKPFSPSELEARIKAVLRRTVERHQETGQSSLPSATRAPQI